MRNYIVLIMLLVSGFSYGEKTSDGAHVNKTIIFDGTNNVLVNSEGQMHVVQESRTDTNNTTKVALGADAVFTGLARDITGYQGGINITVKTDAAGSATKGLVVQYSDNASDWCDGESYTIDANKTKFYSAPSWMPYYRIVYTNGSIAQTNFTLHSMVKKLVGKPSSHNANESINDEDDGELTVSTIQIRKDDGDWIPAKGTDDGNIAVANIENPSTIAFGDVTGRSIVQKFGNAPDFDTGDGLITVWDGADDGDINEMQYNYSSTADIDSVISSSGSDTSVVEIQGLGANSNLVIQTATLNGQTRVALATNLYRVFRVKNENSSEWVGDISVYVTNAPTTGGIPDDTSLIRAHAVAENNQTEMAIYTVAGDKDAIVKGVYFYSAGAKKSAVYEVTLWARPAGGVFQLKWKGSFSDELESGVYHPYTTGLKFSSGTDIECRIKILTGGVTEATLSAGFEIELKDK